MKKKKLYFRTLREEQRLKERFITLRHTGSHYWPYEVLFLDKDLNGRTRTMEHVCRDLSELAMWIATKFVLEDGWRLTIREVDAFNNEMSEWYSSRDGDYVHVRDY